jgi:hypothetical protein
MNRADVNPDCETAGVQVFRMKEVRHEALMDGP